ncbi:MAG: hypothetical protein KDD40_05895, partial [Bdellovibrionales bacterium]|nr:hypothetical protein [Bdellovibrionales bacterium]
MYFNTSNKLTSNFEFRSDLRALLSKFADEALSENNYFVRLNTLIPTGLLQNKYYQQTVNKMDLDSFLIKWKNKMKNFKISVIEEGLPDSFVKRIDILLKIVKGHLFIVKRKDLVKTLVDQDYDLIGGRYVGNYPDPDGYLNVMNSAEKVHM